MMPAMPSNFEYILLRLLRRFVFRDSILLRYGNFIPYYRRNQNQVDPAPVVDEYARHLAGAKIPFESLNLMEIGVGRTNSTCYELAARFSPRSITALEPFVAIGVDEDARLLRQISGRHRCEPRVLSKLVTRVKDISGIAGEQIDLVLSNSVLEHVNDPPDLFRELHRILTPDGAMIHIVDYRDHFFKYPFHFLQFRREVWNRWLNPGNLPVWRLYDHIEQMEAAGFSVRVLEEFRDAAAFAPIEMHIARDYRCADVRLQVGKAVLLAIKVARR